MQVFDLSKVELSFIRTKQNVNVMKGILKERSSGSHMYDRVKKQKGKVPTIYTTTRKEINRDENTFILLISIIEIIKEDNKRLIS